MIHFKPSAFLRGRAQVPAGVRSPSREVPSPAARAGAYGRADHARMLAHAAKRRLASQLPEGAADAGYWKACAPAAVAKAVAIRADVGFARLP